MQDISWAACSTCSYADGWGHMQTRCHTTVSLHPKRPSTIGSVDFPVGQDTSSLLGQTNNRLSSHCVCVRARITECGFSALNDVCECIFGNGGICRTNNKTFVHACAEVHTCSGVLLPQCVRVCYYHPLCWSVLVCVGLCSLRCPLLTAVHKRELLEVTGLSPFTTRIQNTNPVCSTVYSLHTIESFLLVCTCATS